MTDLNPELVERGKLIRSKLDALQLKIEARNWKPTKTQANEVLILMACLAMADRLFPAYQGVPEAIRVACSKAYGERALPAEGV